MAFSTPNLAPAAAPDRSGFDTAGPVVAVERPAEHALELVAESGARLRLDALVDDTLRLRLVAPGDALPPDASYARDPAAEWAGPARWAVRVGEGTVTAETAALSVRVTRSTGRLHVRDRAGRVLLDETSGAAWRGERRAYGLRLEPADRLLGLGDKAFRLDRRGHTVEMWNTDAFRYGPGTDPLYKSVPFVLRIGADTSSGLFLDNPARSFFNLGATQEDELRIETHTGALDLYLLAGETPLGVVQAYARLTGRTPMLPRWALGYHQCRYSYLTEGEVREVAREFRERRIPCDTLYFDIHYMDGFRVFTWDREAFPDPDGLLADLRADGFTSVVIVDPGVKADDPDYDVYADGQAIDAYVRYPGENETPGPEAHGEVWPGRCAFPDFTRADVRAWWGGLHARLTSAGVDGIWNDMNEPALFNVAHVEGSMDAETDVGTLPDSVLHAFEAARGEAPRASHALGHNVYGMLMQRATFEGLLEAQPERRPFTITRAAFAGAQRFGTGWTGDNSATWEHLELAARQVLSLGASGMPFTGADVGGFIGEPSGELLARWTQLGALTPLFRNHSAVDTPRQEPWLFGADVERVCREAIELRYRLLPALYTALWQAATDGRPILRALPLVHPDDETVARTSPLGFYVGDGLLAHPVVAEGQTEREVYLPPAPGWFCFWTGRRWDGRQTIWTQTPLERLPLYVRAGTVLPLGPVRQSTQEPARTLELHAYPARGRHTSTIYEDAGDGWAFRTGDFWLARLTLSDDDARLALEATVDGFHRPAWADGVTVVVHGLAGAPRAVYVGGDDVEAAWDGRSLRVALALAPGGALPTVEVVRS